MTEMPAPAPGLETTEKPNPWQRLAGVFTAPVSTLESIARRPDILVPLLLLMAISIASGILVAQKVNFDALAREAMESAPQTAKMPEAQREQMVRFTAATMKVGSYAAPVFSMIILTIAAGALLIGVRLMGGEGDFKTAFSITTYAWYPRIAKSVLAAIVVLSKEDLGIFDLQDPLRSNPAFLFDPRTQPVLFTLMTSFDIFTIWSIVLLVFGFASMSKLSRGKTAAVVIGLWVVAILFGLIGPAMQAMRSAP